MVKKINYLWRLYLYVIQSQTQYLNKRELQQSLTQNLSLHQDMIKIIVCLSLVSITAHTDITSQKGWNTQRFCTENAPQPYSFQKPPKVLAHSIT